MWAVELRAAHTRVVDECGDAVLEDLAGPLASALKLLPSKRSHVARAAGCSAAGAEPASAMRSAADLQAIPHYSDFPLHSMRKVHETLSHRIHTVRFAKLAARMPTSGPDSNRFRGRLLRAATAFLVTDPPSEGRLGEVRERSPEYYDSMFRVAACRPFGLPAAPVLSLGEPCPRAFCSFSVQGMLARFEDAGVDFTPSTWAVAYADHVARCSGGDSNHAAHEWAAHGLSDICHDVKSALGVGVQVLTDPSVLVSLPKGSDGRPADVGLFGYGGIRGNTVATDTTIAPILGVSSSDPKTDPQATRAMPLEIGTLVQVAFDALPVDVKSIWRRAHPEEATFAVVLIGVVAGRNGAWTTVDFHALHRHELGWNVSIKRRSLVVIGQPASSGGAHQTPVDRENDALLRRALNEYGPDRQDNDATHEEYGPEPTPAEASSEWARTEETINCLRTEEGHATIRLGVMMLQSTLGTSNILTFFLAFLSLHHLEDCLEGMHDYVGSNSGVRYWPPFTLGELYILLGIILAMSNFPGIKMESLWDKEGFPHMCARLAPSSTFRAS
eukprot:jgi/Tetstr1/463361/TSEL_008284.t1